VLRLPQRPPTNLPELVEKRAKFLADYQDEAYARRYRSLVAEIEAAEREKAKGFSGLARAAAENLFKLMAYKDEYEVARLYTDGGFEESLRKTFDGDFRIEFHLAPPIFGDAKKRTFGPWMLRVFKVLAKLKHLRGTKLDVFGRTEERRMERRLIEEYETLLREIAQKLSPENHGTAVALANVPQDMRGFGHIKRDAVEKAKKREAELLSAFRSPAPLPAAVAAE
jgi:indolepyruvate ferredoxin oxidoreductase